MLGQSQEDLALPAGDAGGQVQQPVTQGFGFGPVKVALVGQEHRLGQGKQVRGDQGELDPDLVDVGVPGGRCPMPVSLPVRIRSSTRAWARCRASRNGSCPLGVLVVKAWYR